MNKLLLMGVLIGGAALVSACVQTRSSDSPLVVNVKRDGADCRVTVESERVTTERLLEIGRSARSRRAIVVYDKDTPYKCIGGAIFNLQRAGLVSVDAAVWHGN